MEFIPIKPMQLDELKDAIQPEPPKPEEVKNHLILLCEAIKEYEGWFAGSRSFRNNNPGNCKFSSVGYLPKYGLVKRDEKNFAIFPSYEIGWEYLKNLIISKAQKKPDQSLVNFFKEYAPAEDDNDPTRYASWVGRKMGVNPFTFQLKNLIGNNK